MIGASAALVMAAGEAQGLGMFVQERGLLMRATNKQRSHHHDISVELPLLLSRQLGKAKHLACLYRIGD